jgi:hypothetical protein
VYNTFKLFMRIRDEKGVGTMRDKRNYILGGITVLLFSMVASTGILQMGRGFFHRSAGIMGQIEDAMVIHVGQLHRWLALLFVLLGIYVIIRHWSWIVSMTEIIRMERAARENPFSEGDEAESLREGETNGDSSYEGVITPISEDEVEELEQELDEPEEVDGIDEIEELDDEAHGTNDDDHDAHKE